MSIVFRTFQKRIPREQPQEPFGTPSHGTPTRTNAATAAGCLTLTAGCAAGTLNRATVGLAVLEPSIARRRINITCRTFCCQGWR